ncbi:Bug family tripartite tricarboxylate transporter substrate binding protein [Chelativorans xinjiangense]|uniref:Bug family tripartite tricarboxylate transporter substrate binding protein n=1 Tax=Chelativorans xinjiangense TaxID=2681485 RepID=UPI001357F7F4|nr:hypothetical protein [Chelativorans xinjiangense]
MLAAALTVTGIAAGTAFADESAVAEFYSGKTVRFVVGTRVGSGGDTYARLIADHIGKHIPGNPNVIVENMPAAGGLVQANWMYNQADRDGTVVGLTRESIPFEPILLGDASKAEFKLDELIWLSSPNMFPNVAISWHTSDVKTVGDLLENELIVGGIGQTGSTNDAYVLRNLLGFKYRVINGYPGPSEIDLAVENGELEGRATAGWTGLSTRHADWLRDGKINILYQTGAVKYPRIPDDVPSLMDFAKTDEQRAILELKYGSNAVGFPFFFPPEVPQERVDAVRKAFEATYADPEFIKAAEAQHVDVFPVSHQEMEAVYKKAYESPQELRDKLAELSKPPAD